MPNFNGAIVVHTLQLLNAPSTLREILVTIAKKTELPQEDLRVPVKQTLDMGQRFGFLQKNNGRYYLEPMTFTRLMMALDSSDITEKSEKSVKKPIKKLVTSTVQKKSDSLQIKSAYFPPYRHIINGTAKNPNPIPKKPIYDNISIASSNKTGFASRKSVQSVAIKPRPFK